MALPQSQRDREYINFKDNGDGTVSRYVYVVNPGGGGGGGDASEATLQLILAELTQKLEPADIANLALDSSLQSILTELGTKLEPGDISFIASEATLTALSAKIIKADTDNVTVVSSALPTGAATAAAQATGNASLASIDTKLTSPISVSLSNNSVLVYGNGYFFGSSLSAVGTFVTDDFYSYKELRFGISGTWSASIVVEGSHNNATWFAIPVADLTSPTSLPSVSPITTNGVFYVPINARYLRIRVSAYTSGTVTLNGVASSLTGSNDLVARSVSVSASALPTGAATAANQATANASLSSIDSKLTAPISVVGPLTDAQLRATPVPISGTVTANAGTDLNTSALALEATQLTGNTRLGDLTETAPGTDTASSGLNGRLQRIAQRITSLITAITDRTQKTQITNGTLDGQIETSSPSLSANGFVVRPLPYRPQAYRAATAGFTLAASPTDIFGIVGSGSKTINVKKIGISGRTTSGSAVAVVISAIKRSTANTGGTAVTATNVPINSTFAAATATVRHYTANPTLGTSVGAIMSHSITFQQSGLTPRGELYFEFDNPIVLNGTSESVYINFNATSVTGSSIACFVEWEEV